MRHTTVGFVRVVLAVVVSVTDVGRVGADAGATLKLPWPAFELSYNTKNNQPNLFKIVKSPI